LSDTTTVKEMDMSEQTDGQNSAGDLMPPMAGFRLSKIELFNWGTFDGSVFSVQTNGKTTLLVGENGSGKSTLVDALLTLLVRPQTRNYNVAAGATKNERDEKSYIRGAFDRTMGDGNSPQVQSHRTGRDHYTVILATFANASNGKVFTLCQVLYLNAENGVEKVYGYADCEKGIVKDLGDLQSSASLSKQLRDRGFKSTTSYTEYFGWFQKTVRFRSKAMDVFNQTVAVKDVQKLDEFVRKHMLERKSWNERVGQLLKHFAELSETHRMLVRVRRQDEFLKPIAEDGKRYRKKLAEIESAKRFLDSIDLYFADKLVLLLQPLCEQWSQEIDRLVAEVTRLGELHQDRTNEIARLKLEIENRGGDRMRQLPGIIQHEEQLAKIKAASRLSFENQIRVGGIHTSITSPDQFSRVIHEVQERLLKLSRTKAESLESRDKIQFEIGSLKRKIAEERSELEALERRRNGNLPESFITLRERLCQDLHLSPSDLPFVAELIAVKQSEQAWEASIEQVMYSFARSLLVPREHYARVSGYIDRTRIVDSRGHGQRLVYLNVGTQPLKSTSDGSNIDSRSLVLKLDYRHDHPMRPWITAEIQNRFQVIGCETIEEFQGLHGAAMTKNRHLKSNQSRHEKDDRSHPDDRRHFVLGWDNKQKKQSLKLAIQNSEAELANVESRSQKFLEEFHQLTACISALEEAAKISSYDLIDDARHEVEAQNRRMELQTLEQSSDIVRELKRQISERTAEAIGYQADRDHAIEKKTIKQNEWKQGHSVLQAAERRISEAKALGRWEDICKEFGEIEKTCKVALTIDNLGTLPNEFRQQQNERFVRLQDQLKPIAKELTSGMGKFLREFPDIQTDLDPHVDSLDSFFALQAKISSDELPQHEARFKKRLNEKVLQEIGALRGNLEQERQEIRDRIDQLNVALKLLEWKPGTFMQIETSDRKDQEILDFRRELTSCLQGSMSDAEEVNEATFNRIKKLVDRFNENADSRWREKVIDVRNWFNFAAQEIVAATGATGSYYDGGTGQSGGEKGKLAFLVLVAAIAYQYDIDPDADESDRFHFVMVDEMFSRSDDAHAEYALKLFEQFKLQLLIVAPLDAKARVTEPFVGTYLHVVKDKNTHKSQLIAITAEEHSEAD
jgi:uncharacterized protein YPO0396